MSDKMKQEFVSIGITFVSSFLLTLGGMLTTTDSVQWTGAFALSLVIAAGRSAFKAAIEKKLLSAVGAPKN